MTQIDDLNSLCADLLDGKIGEAEFRHSAMIRFGYDQDEATVIIKKLRRRAYFERRTT